MNRCLNQVVKFAPGIDIPEWPRNQICWQSSPVSAARYGYVMHNFKDKRYPDTLCRKILAAA